MFSHPNPSLTARVCPVQPATIHITHKQLRIEEKRGQQKHHLTQEMEHRPRTPVQELPNSPLAPESRTNGVRSWSIIPQRRRRHRLTDAARTSIPQRRPDRSHTSAAGEQEGSRADERIARKRLPTTRAEAEKAKTSHRVFAEVHTEVVAVDLAKDPEEPKSPG